MKKVHTDNAPAAIGPYSQAIVHGDMVFTSGQIPINPETGNVEAEDIVSQTEQVMKNLGAVLSAAGSSYEKAIKTTLRNLWSKITTPYFNNTKKNIIFVRFMHIYVPHARGKLTN